MYLKRLDVSGFKSFANKTSVEFVPGVTAVVGPNGSGKSNITEAIRWVLGEQSAKSLRGSKMEDIIFSGSEAKKAVNMAEVTLLLDNGDHYLPFDYSEISVTRRVYRSGDSDFLLNGQNCRLKDIVDLFMDSGLGKEAYSVIGQGKIDEILNSKAEDKRKIFEEASGVLKYKLRKQAAEKRLNESEENLNRIEDILHEIESRLTPLEKAASAAKDYLEKKAELKEVDVALLTYDIEQTHTKWEAAKKQVDALTGRKQASAQSISEKERLFRSGRAALSALDREVETLQAEWAKSGEKLEKLIGQKEVLTERRKHATSNAEEMKERVERMEEQLEVEIRQLEQAKASLRSEKKKLKDVRGELKQKMEAYSGFEQNLDEQIEQLKSEYIEVLNHQASMRNERRYLTEQQAALAEKKSRMETKTEDAFKKAEAAQKRKADWERKVEHQAAEGRKLQQELETSRRRLRKEKERYDKLKETLDKIARLIDQAVSRKDMLEAMKEDYAGFYQGVRAVLKKRRELPGIHGAVAELIHVDRTYETAIETALGASAQHVIVADEAAGRKAILFLREHRAGRATFLPLSVIRPRGLTAGDRRRIEGHADLIDTADRLVRCDSLFEPVIRHLLGSIVVAATLPGANRLAKLLGYRYRIVTLEGDVVSAGGAMTGGSLKQNRTSLIARSGEIDELGRKIKEMRGKSRELKQEFSDIKQRIAADETDTARLEENVRQAAESYHRLEGLVREAQADEKNSRDKYQLLEREQGDFASEHAAISDRLKKIDNEMAEHAKKEQSLTEKINRLSQNKKNREASKAALQSEITSLKVRAAEQAQIAGHQEEKTRQAARRTDELHTSLDALRASIRGIDADLENQSESRQSLEEHIQSARQEKEQLALLLEEKKRNRRSEQEKISEEERLLEKERRTFDKVSGRLQEEEIALGRLDVRLDHLLDTLRQEYELTIEAAKQNYPLKLEVHEARKKVKLIKRAIDELGPVNVGAIEEYENVSERARFLSAQRDDLLKARATLENIMSEMDNEVKKRFSKTFREIRKQFRIVFRQLFGGGQADLRLIDPDDLLTSGVDIFAEPPGKKLQRLTLLSGGERALTATALLFAILKVRPVPFCVLDEVEAALDDANVDRYADFLKTFSAQTQFIVVTHRHGTMERADVLYGVTMQESGISKLVSVRLEETEELLAAGRN
ncbi:chromosome segregation protein SMC [Sporolactobacillus sp. THM7-7]|nr:chromosome segregation protein SMC [Sporolactobacillus sp. THM7-7]